MVFFHHISCLTDVVPAEILAQGQASKSIYENALRKGSVKVYRARIMLIGPARVGKTSLKKSLLGLPFDPKRTKALKESRLTLQCARLTLMELQTGITTAKTTQHCLMLL